MVSSLTAGHKPVWHSLEPTPCQTTPEKRLLPSSQTRVAHTPQVSGEKQDRRTARVREDGGDWYSIPSDDSRMGNGKLQHSLRLLCMGICMGIQLGGWEGGTLQHKPRVLQPT